MTIYKVTGTKDIFGVSVGIIMDDNPIVKEKYEPKSCINKKAWAEGGVGATVGMGAAAGLAGGGSQSVAKSAATAGVISLAVGGAIAGVSSLYEAVNHQRVAYVTIRNCSERGYTFLGGYNNYGHASVPQNIPARSIARLAFHNEGSFSGAVCFASKVDYLYVGASNPMIGKNKLRVECTDIEYDLYKYWDDMDCWDTKENCGRDVVLSNCVYDNPSQCFVDIKE